MADVCLEGEGGELATLVLLAAINVAVVCPSATKALQCGKSGGFCAPLSLRPRPLMWNAEWGNRNRSAGGH
ncbi:hypothetical protein ACLKA6_015390 [Drosophila palustris]